MKRYIKSNTSASKMWATLSGASQTAVEHAYSYHDSGMPWYDAIQQAVADTNEANYEPEFEGMDFYGEEADIDDVTRYIELDLGRSLFD